MKQSTSFRVEQSVITNLEKIANDEGINRTQALVNAVNQYRTRTEQNALPKLILRITQEIKDENAEIKRSLQEIRWMITKLGE